MSIYGTYKLGDVNRIMFSTIANLTHISNILGDVEDIITNTKIKFTNTFYNASLVRPAS
jgi:hypothetical protein